MTPPLLTLRRLVLFLYCSTSLVGCFSTSFPRKQNILIAAPRSKQDWQQLATLVVHVFDAPQIKSGTLEWLTWTLLEQQQTINQVYQRHVATARQLQGSTKYVVLVAKEEQHGAVIGMVELGVSTSRRATVGVVCVDPNWQGCGVGTMLLNKCIDVVCRVWKDCRLYVEVEESNQSAIQFFEKQGFVTTGQTVVVKVQLKQRVEERPHVVLCKDLTMEGPSSKLVVFDGSNSSIGNKTSNDIFENRQ